MHLQAAQKLLCSHCLCHLLYRPRPALRPHASGVISLVGHGGSIFGSTPSMGRARFSDVAGAGALTDDPTRSVPKSREASGHGGTLFSSAVGLAGPRPQAVLTESPAVGKKGLQRDNSASKLWDWIVSPSTPGSTLEARRPTDIADVQAVVGVQSIARQKSASFLWDWGKYRGSPPRTPAVSPGNSVEGGNNWATISSSAAKKAEGSKGLGFDLPKTLTRAMSLGSLSEPWRPTLLTPPLDPCSPPATSNSLPAATPYFSPSAQRSVRGLVRQLTLCCSMRMPLAAVWDWGKKEPDPEAKTGGEEKDDDDDIPKTGHVMNQSLG